MTAIFISGKSRGAIIGLVILGALLFYYAVGLSNPTDAASASQTSSQVGNFFSMLATLSFILVLVAAQLRGKYEQSDTARLMGGITASIFLIFVLIMIFEFLSAVPSEILGSIPLNISEGGFLATLSVIIFVACGLGLVTSAVLSVINFGRWSSSSGTIAGYTFSIGLLSLLVLLGWTLLLLTIVIIQAGGGRGAGWVLFFIYRMFFMFGALVFIFGTGTHDWLKRFMPSA